MLTATKKHRNRSLAPKRWRNILTAIPGYDPFRDAKDCWFDSEQADRYVEFIETCCTHIEGDINGQPFILEKWQKAIIGNLFGWYKHDFLNRVVRRYRKCLIYVPRKNGKTPLIAAIANAIFFMDDEAGQINNIAAASRDQASKLFRHILGQINNEYEMRSRCQYYSATKTLTKDDNSIAKVISSDGKVNHGDNPHFQAIDELHTQPNSELYNTLVSAMSSANRINPLIIFVTTADFDRPSVCNDEYKYACKVRDGFADEEYMPVIYEAMHKNKDGRVVEDDWTDINVWYKANPNLGISVSLDYMHSVCRRAKEDLGFLNEFKRLNLNIRTGQAEAVISMDDWDACTEQIDWTKYTGKSCWAALDIGAIRDFVSLILLFGDNSGEIINIEQEDLKGEKKQIQFIRRDYYLKHFCWLPASPPVRDPRMELTINIWSQQGLITRTPGNVVDYDIVGQDISRILKPYGLISLAVDQGFQGMQITQDLQKLFGEERILAFRQGILSMAAPFREIMQLLALHRLHHDGDPVLRWMAGNVAAESRGGLIKPSKDKSTEKIDGITALTMAVGIAMTSKEIGLTFSEIIDKEGKITI